MNEPLDWVALRAQCAGDEQLVSELISLFLRQVDGQLNDVSVAVAARDGVALGDSAHRLKGALVALAAGPASALAVALETSANSKKLHAAPALLAELHAEITRLVGALSTR